MSVEQRLNRRQFLIKAGAILAPTLPLANAVAEIRKSDDLNQQIPAKLDSSYPSVHSPALEAARETMKDTLNEEVDTHRRHAVVSTVIGAGIATGEIIFSSHREQAKKMIHSLIHEVPPQTKDPSTI